MLKRTLLTALAAAAMLAFAASAQAAYLSLGTTNTSNATTALSGNTTGSELLVKNTNGSSAGSFGLYGLLTATSPTATAAAVRGQNNSTNARGYGVWGSQAGSGTGVYGLAPSGKGVWGNTSSGTGVRGSSSSGGYGVYGSSPDGKAVFGTSTSGSGLYGQSSSGDAVDGESSSGYGLFGSSTNSAGVYGASSSGRGVAGFSGSWQGVYGHSGSQAGVVGDSNGFDGVYGTSFASGDSGVSGHNQSSSGTGYGVWGGAGASGTGVFGGAGATGTGVYGTGGTGVEGVSSTSTGVFGAGGVGATGNGTYDGLEGFSHGTALYASGGSYAGYFDGHVQITGGCTGCAGPSVLHIDDPLDPAHKYLNHASVTSSQQLNVYSGNVTTNGKGFATVRMPRWFQALNRSFRYQLTVVGKPGQFVQAMIVKELAHNHFTLETSKPSVKVSWQVTAVRHDRFAKAHPTRVIVSKPKADQGKYVNPQVYGKARSDGIGYRKPPRVPPTATVKR
jgi:hypothetical protein